MISPINEDEVKRPEFTATGVIVGLSMVYRLTHIMGLLL